ncbi:MAG: hypothetical protein SGCHY_003362, partial [Lobulomycetales sp.]
IGSNIATPRSNSNENRLSKTKFDSDSALCGELEEWIDEYQDKLPPLSSFILPSGGKAASSLHVARSVCRRTERRVCPLVSDGGVDRSVAMYLNRLSDFLFAASRHSSHHLGVAEVSYTPKHDMDLLMCQGDTIEVTGQENWAWCCGRNTRTNRFGSFPIRCVDVIEHRRQPTPPSRLIEDDKPDPSSIDYQAADSHARSASLCDEESVASLSRYLLALSPVKEMQLRACFVWICDHISYDYPGFINGTPGPQDADSVLRTRLAVCEGYANLFCGLHPGVEKIHGYGKGVGSTAGMESIPQKDDGSISNHAWNATQLSGRHYFLETTWGSGTIQDDGLFTRKLQTHYFLTKPNQLIYSHFPADPRKQYLDTPLSQEEFMALPYVKPKYFELKCEIISPSDLPMLSILDVHDTPVRVTLRIDHGECIATLRWPHEGNGLEVQALCQMRRDKHGDLTANILAFCPGFGQGLLTVFGRCEGESKGECLTVFLVRNSGNQPGRQMVQSYSSEYKLTLNLPVYGDLRCGDTEDFELQDFDGEVRIDFLTLPESTMAGQAP